jgi:hypothetical protein
MAVVTIRPTSTLITSPDYQHWANSRVPSGTASKNTWSLVDESVADDDTSFFQCSTAGHSFEFFGMGATGVSEGNITNVRVVFRCKHATATGYSRACVGTAPTTGNYSYGATKTSSTSYQNFTEDWATNPRTSSAWAWSDFTNYYFGVDGWGSSNKSNNRCTQFYVEISYTLPQTTIQGCIIQGCIIS